MKHARHGVCFLSKIKIKEINIRLGKNIKRKTNTKPKTVLIIYPTDACNANHTSTFLGINRIANNNT